MSRTAGRLRSPGEGPREARPTTPGDRDEHRQTRYRHPLAVARGARGAARAGEGAHPRARRDGGRAPPHADDPRGEGLSLHRARGGDATLLDLFDGSPQPVVYRFFMDPDMDVFPERGCPGCSMYADQLSNLLHLRERDTRFVAFSRGEQEHLQRYREHMGWEFPWYTLRDDFDADHDVAEWHGTNVFLRDGDEVFRTYFIDARGDEALVSTWSSSTSPRTAARRSGRTPPRTGRRPRPTPGPAGMTSTTTHSDVLAHVAASLEEALLAGVAWRGTTRDEHGGVVRLWQPRRCGRPFAFRGGARYPRQLVEGHLRSGRAAGVVARTPARGQCAVTALIVQELLAVTCCWLRSATETAPVRACTTGIAWATG